MIYLQRDEKHKEKAKKCKQCDFASEQAGTLKTHMKTHSGDKSHKCNQCEYSSFYANYLKKHLRRHRKTIQMRPVPLHVFPERPSNDPHENTQW